MRICKKPSMKEINACRPWLDAELETVKPKLIVALGATAAQGLLGSSFRITQEHGKVQDVEGLPPIVATLHPSAILRAQTDEDRHAQMRMLVEDLKEAKRVAGPNTQSSPGIGLCDRNLSQVPKCEGPGAPATSKRESISRRSRRGW